MNKLQLVLYNIIYLCILGVALGYFYWFSSLYPFFFSWDMDLTTTIDSVLIHSYLLPAHFAHSSFGIYFITHITESIARWLGYISFFSFDDLKNFPNPILGIGELTDFIRLHNPFIGITLVSFAFYSLYLTFKKQRAILVFILLLFATESSLQVLVDTTRSELYSVMFWSLSLLLGAFAVQTKSYKRKIILYFALGITAGIMFTTKIQSIFYLVSLPILILGMEGAQQHSSFSYSTENTKIKFGKIAYANFIIFISLTIISFVIPTELLPGARTAFSIAGKVYDVAAFRDGYRITPQWIAIFLFFYLSFFLQKRSRHAALLNALHFLTILSSGFLFSFFLALTLYPTSIFLGLIHLIITFKISILGVISTTVAPPSVIQSFYAFKSNILKYFTLYLFVFSTIIFYFIAQNKKMLPKNNIISTVILLISSIQLTFLYTSIRQGANNDLIWNQTLTFYLFSFLILYNLTYLTKKIKLPFFIASISMLTILVVINCKNQSMPEIFSFKYPPNKNMAIQFIDSVYAGNQLQYRDKLKPFYPPSKTTDLAMDQAKYFHQIINIYKKVFQIYHLNLKNVNLLYPHSLLSLNNHLFRVKSFSKKLTQSTLITLNQTVSVKKLEKINDMYFFTSNSGLKKINYAIAPTITLIDEQGNLVTFYGIKLTLITISFINHLLSTPNQISFLSISHADLDRYRTSSLPQYLYFFIDLFNLNN